ncbi:MAG: pentapeptide repeat-containing protein [Actinomycetales bacterium]|nr:pentapeptide repeat-containing protein [Candidatus Phosphoribacter baldrii]
MAMSSRVRRDTPVASASRPAYACLRRANLTGADFTGADVRNANMKPPTDATPDTWPPTPSSRVTWTRLDVDRGPGRQVPQRCPVHHRGIPRLQGLRPSECRGEGSDRVLRD